MDFVHLHLHTEYSLLDGVGKIDEYIAKAKTYNMPAIAITDHGNMFGAMEFYKKSKASGIKPIIGLEAYISEFNMSEKSGRNFHLVLLAKNNIGYQNLLKITSESYLNGFYYKPRVDKDFLKKHSDGIIALSACMNGEIGTKILHNEDIDSCILEYLEIFGRDNFYLEVQYNGLPEQNIVNEKILTLSQKYNLKMVATNDTHYINRGDHILQDIMICVQTGTKMDDKNRMHIETEELYFKKRDEIGLDSRFTTALDNTVEIANRCNLEIDFGGFKFPNYEIPQEFSSVQDYLKYLVEKGLKKIYHIPSENISKRANYELDIINKMGYSEYFIVVWDFINFARKNGIPIGPGRGSAAGSLVSYALGITRIDPMKYNLIFERFLNPERVSMPDIDIDICQERRQEVIDYVISKYGADKVAQIITFGRMKARAAIRDVGRVLNVPISDIDKVTKFMHHNQTIEENLQTSPELQKIYSTNKNIKNVIDIAKRLENKARHASIHAAGVVITRDNLTENVPLYMDNKQTISTQYQMKELEILGLLKMDFLGLRNLTNLQRTISLIKQCKNIDISLDEIPLDLKEIYEMLGQGDTSGVFQLESNGIRKILKRLKPNQFEDIIALLALYRPGPLGSGMVDDFIKGKHGGDINYPHPALEDILKETYGVILYQEQVMKIAHTMAGYTLGEADILRRAMGKKNDKLMQENREKFINRSVKNGYTKSSAEMIFSLIDKFAGYGFNKSHSAAYALISYWTAYFKAYYTEYYYASLLTSEISHIDNIGYYVEDAVKHNIKLNLPNVNKPAQDFTVDDGIIFSLASVKNVGSSMAKMICYEHDTNGNFKDFLDFVSRMKNYGINKKMVESLVLCGALDCVAGTRKSKFENVGVAIDIANKLSKNDEIQQMNFFGNMKIPRKTIILNDGDEFTSSQMLEFERDTLGFYFSSHPLDKYKNIIEIFRLTPVSELVNGRVMTFGIIENIKKILTKNSKNMAIFELVGIYGRIQCVVFPQTFEKFHVLIQDKSGICITGRIQNDYFRGEETKKLIADGITRLDILPYYAKKLYINLTHDDKAIFVEIKKVLKENFGNSEVFFVNKSDHKIVQSKYKVSITMNLINSLLKFTDKRNLYIKTDG